jgi:hypothetical protein
MLRKSIINEFIKLKRSGILILSTLGTVITNVLFVGTAFALVSIPDLGQQDVMNSWATWINYHYQGIMPMLLPMYLVILCALSVNQEKRYGTWKLLALLPVKPSSIYLAKLLIVALVFALSHLIFVLLMWLLPYILHFDWISQPFPAEQVSLLYLTTILSSLGTLALVFLISYFSKNFIAPLAAGILGFVLSQLLHDNNIPDLYFPFSLPLEGLDVLKTTTVFPLIQCLISMIFFVLLTFIAVPLTKSYHPRQ